MMVPWKVSRSTIAAHKRGSVNVLVQPEKDSLVAMATDAFSSRSVSTWKRSSAPRLSRGHPARWRFRGRQRLSDRSARDAVLLERDRIDKPLILASPAYPREKLHSRFHHCLPPLEKHPDGINRGVGQLKLRFINRRAAKWAQTKLQTRSPLKLP